MLARHPVTPVLRLQMLKDGQKCDGAILSVRAGSTVVRPARFLIPVAAIVVLAVLAVTITSA